MKSMLPQPTEEIVFPPRDPRWDDVDTDEATLTSNREYAERVLDQLWRELESATSKEMILFLTGAIALAKDLGRAGR